MPLPSGTPSQASLPQTPWSFLFWHAVVSLMAGIAALFITEGGLLYPPFLFAILYTVALGTLLNFLNARGTTLWIWTLGLPIGALFVVWLPPFGWMFSLGMATTFFTIRAMDWGEKGWLVPLAFYGGSILYVMATTW